MTCRAPIALVLCLLAFASTACTTDNPTDSVAPAATIAAAASGDDGSGASTTATEPVEEPTTKAVAIAQIEELCRRFLVDLVDSPDPDVRERGAQAAYATFRTSVIDRTVPNIATVRLPSGDEALVTRGLDAFAGARARYQAALATDTDVEAAATLLFDGDVKITSYAVELVGYGASACLPGQRPSPPPPPPADAGRLLDVAPALRLEVAAPGAAPNRLVADDDAVWVGFRYLPELVRVDARTGVVTRRVDLTPVGRALLTNLFLDGDTLWGTTRTDLFRHDTATGRLTSRSLASLNGASGAPVAVLDGRGYLCGSANRLVRFDTATLAPVEVLPLPGGCDGLVVAGGRLHVDAPGAWYALDDAGKVTGFGDPPGDGGQSRTTIEPPVAWQVFGESGVIRRFDLRSGAEKFRLVRTGRSGLTNAAAGGVLYSTRPGENRVLRVDPTGTLSEVVAGSGPSVLATTATALWVANEHEGTIMRFDLAALAAA